MSREIGFLNLILLFLRVSVQILSHLSSKQVINATSTTTESKKKLLMD